MPFNELGTSRPFFTKDFHRDVYNAIDPTKPELALLGKTVLITGAGRGIGLGVVDSFAKAQAKTIILTGRSEASLKNAKVTFEKAYPRVQFITTSVDIGVPTSVDALFAGLKGKVDTVDILVNNAGVLNEYGPKVGDTDVDKFWDDMSANGRGPYLLARGQIHFNPTDYAATYITFTTGVNEPLEGMTAYLLSKVSAVKLIQILDLEYPNLRTFAVLPGIVPTDMMPPVFEPLALDKAPLSGGLSVWLSHPQADFLSGRFMDGRWDIEQVVERKDEIVKNDWLKLSIGGY